MADKTKPTEKVKQPAKETEVDETETEETEEENEETEETDGDEDADGDDDEEEGGKKKAKKQQADEAASRQKALKEENIQRRLENKKLKAELDSLKKKSGKAEAETIEGVKSASEKKIRTALIRAEVASVASDAQDHGLLLSALGSLEDLDVDTDEGSVDRETLEEKVAALREKKPFLFKAKGKSAAAEGDEAEEEVDPKSVKSIKLNPDKNGQPKGGKSHYAVYKTLKTQGRHKEAQEYYNKHHKLINSQA